MRIDANGIPMRQVTVWLPVEVVDLMRADGLNVSRFIRDQLEILYGLEDESETRRHRDRLAAAVRQTFEEQRRVATETEADRERVRAAVRVMRAERDAANDRQTEITAVLGKIIGKKVLLYRRMLPENDPHGDRMGDWDALVRRVSRLCGAEIDSAEVAAALRRFPAPA